MPGAPKPSGDWSQATIPYGSAFRRPRKRGPLQAAAHANRRPTNNGRRSLPTIEVKMSSTQSQAFRPLVSSPTMTNSANIGSIVSRWRRKQISVPEFQRDSSQWDDEKKSLFIESIINGLTIPPIILYPEDDKEAGFEVQQVIDGQQRITAMRIGRTGALSAAPPRAAFGRGQP